MALIEGVDIQKLVELLQQKNVYFYHACQLKDFLTYLRIGGIPSRKHMEENQHDFTSFDTDEVDKDNQVWDLVFGNLSDFGSSFAKGKWGEKPPVPNPYGPITLYCSPKILLEADDIAICLRSAGGSNFDREEEGLAIEDVPKIFYCLECTEDYKEPWIKFSEKLKEAFNIKDSKTYNPEISCSSPKEFLPLQYVEKIIVDEIPINDTTLREIIREKAKNNSFHVDIYNRFYHDTEGKNRKEILHHLVNCIHDGLNDFNSVYSKSVNHQYTKDWLDKIKTCGNVYQFNRYLKYLSEGTFSFNQKNNKISFF